MSAYEEDLSEAGSAEGLVVRIWESSNPPG